ncbi:MAG: glutathione S-transferase [Kordiimonadaceae bacterium]|nr:glutathione S-transferase [Kordiimonadaceae bacterium]
MIKIHHLNNSRSQRHLWMLEELGVDYEIIHYQRDAKTRLAPDSLLEIHPLGKAPVLEDGDLKIAESGAALDYLARTYSRGTLCPRQTDPDYERYNELMHHAEGSAILPLLLGLYVSLLGDAGAPLGPRISSQVDLQISYLEGTLGDSDYFMGTQISAVDVHITFVLEFAEATGALAKTPNLQTYLKRVQARPAYARALKKGGVYSLGS